MNQTTKHTCKTEYPATHSMSTSWFGIDKDGKVAIIDFNENGPVPATLEENTAEDIIESMFPSQLEMGLSEIPLTDSQAEEVIQKLHFSTTDEDIDFEHIVKINPAHATEFISILSKYHNHDGSRRIIIRLNEQMGLYLCDFNNVENEVIRSLISRRVILRNQSFYWDYDEHFDTKKNKWIVKQNDSSCILPFYYFVQPYSPDQLIERVLEPKSPISEDQITPEIRAKGLHFPFSFHSQKAFQILEYYRSHSMFDDINPPEQ